MMGRVSKVILCLVVSAIGLLLICRSSPACEVDELYLTKAGYLAAITPGKLKEATAYREKADLKGLAAMTNGGAVVRLKGDIKVRVLERSFEHEMLKIEFPGEETPYWVEGDALKPVESNKPWSGH